MSRSSGESVVMSTSKHEIYPLSRDTCPYMANGTTRGELQAELDTVLADAKVAREQRAWAEGCVHCGHRWADHAFQPPLKSGEWPPKPSESVPCKGKHDDGHLCGCLSFHARGYEKVTA